MKKHTQKVMGVPYLYLDCKGRFRFSISSQEEYLTWFKIYKAIGGKRYQKEVVEYYWDKDQ